MTLFDKVWQAHVVKQLADGVALLFNREILIRTRTAIQSVSRGHLVCPSAGGCRRR